MGKRNECSGDYNAIKRRGGVMDEKMRILKMVEEGKISSDEANKLLEVIDAKSQEIKGKLRWLKVKVFENGKQTVNVKVPFSLIKVGIKLGGKINIKLPEVAKEKLAEKGISIENIKDVEKLNELLAELEKEAPFELVNVDEDNERVIVSIE